MNWLQRYRWGVIATAAGLFFVLTTAVNALWLMRESSFGSSVLAALIMTGIWTVLMLFTKVWRRDLHATKRGPLDIP